MERPETEIKDEALKTPMKLQLLHANSVQEVSTEIEFKTPPNSSHKSIQLAGAFSLLSSIKSVHSRRTNTKIADEEESETMVGVARDLMVQLVREKCKNKKMKILNLMEFILAVVLIFTLLSVVLVFLIQGDEGDDVEFYC